MKRTILALFLLTMAAALTPSTAEAIVRLKNVSQSGVGSTGTVRIEFNGNYDRSKVKINYESDHVSFMLNDAFVMPVKKVFKSSSAKSSVSRMEATMAPSTKRSGGTVRLNVYFRVPIETIKSTGSLSGSANVVNFNYKTAGETRTGSSTEAKGQEEIAADASQEASMPEGGLQDNGDQGIKENPETEAKTREIEERMAGAADQDQDSGTGIWEKIASLKSMMLSALKIVAILLGVIVLLFLGVFFFKKHSEQKRLSATTMDLGPLSASGGSIRVISSFNLEDDKKLYIIQIEGERMLVGTSRNSVSMITKLSQPEQPEEISREHEAIMRSRLKDKLRNL